ncbi:hypothetical protein KCU99_g9475, partial [Aureobasidium melanogenum]
MKTIERKKADHEASVQKEIEVEDKEEKLEKEYAQSWRDRVNSCADLLCNRQVKLNILNSFKDLEDEIRWLLSESGSPELVAASQSHAQAPDVD